MDNRHPPHLRIRIALVERGLSITEAARRLGRSRAYTNAMISGWYPMSRPMARDLAALLDLDPESLMVEREEAAAS